MKKLEKKIDLELTLRCNLVLETVKRKEGDKMTIKEVSKMFGLTNDTLRYYERVGLIGPIEKTESGIRNYQNNDLKRIEFVKCMRSAEIPIAVLLQYMRLYDEGQSTEKERKTLLENQKKILEERIKDMQEAYEKVIYKIELYDKNELKYE